MTLSEILTHGGGTLLVLMTLVQLAPIKINPWSTIARWVGKAINGEVLDKLGHVEKRLDEHIKTDDERDADLHRTRILQFNTELLRDIRHTEEDFSEILYNIDCYERYCREHPDYQNNRAVHAIANICRVYDERLAKHDFL
ncbi:hypothetical protein [Acutalibacter muris]|uniref:hypothetical protein n=1 Tax=Acutalibacter muris TaxID=1796620 RepID=UPI001C3EB84C|nr:hypothetical protein [Acutalibacter muris]